jgi:hypothetical protein
MIQALSFVLKATDQPPPSHVGIYVNLYMLRYVMQFS